VLLQEKEIEVSRDYLLSETRGRSIPMVSGVSRLEALFNEIKTYQALILMELDGEKRDLIADRLDELRAIYSRVCEKMVRAYQEQS